MNGKRLELLKESVPKLQRVGVVSNLTNPTQPLEWKEIEVAAKVLGLKLQSLGVQSINDFDGVFKVALTERTQALMNLPEALVNAILTASPSSRPSTSYLRCFPTRQLSTLVA